MEPDMNDASYRFVREANRKEALNARKRLERLERAKNPSPWWSAFVTCLMVGITANYVHFGDTAMAALFAILTIWHLYLTHINFKKRRSLV